MTDDASNPYLEAVIATIRTLRPEDLLVIDKLARRLKEIERDIDQWFPPAESSRPDPATF